METNSLSALAPTGSPMRSHQQQLAPGNRAARNPASPSERILRDARLRRPPPKPGKDGERPKVGRGAAGRTKPWASANALVKPLLPVTERGHHEENLAGRRAKKGSQDGGKWDLTPEGGSAGREGRKFAVANVGNNGRIYLRPTVRPVHQRYPQPPFVFPMTPPSTAGLDPVFADQGQGSAVASQLHGDQCSPSLHPSTSPSLGRGTPGEKLIRIRQRHRRAMSDSTVPDTSVARESEMGTFKVVVKQPGEERPRTVQNMDTSRPPLLEVSIPSWRIGTPRFSVRGTPFIRGSSYAPTEEFRSSSASFLRLTSHDAPSRSSRIPSLLQIPGPHHASADDAADPPTPSSPRLPRQLRATYVSPHLVIEPDMFDALTFKPACDERTVVRYSATGSVTAATPSRLVAEITSPSFLDYELLSDFFLTYRSFVEASDLVRMLFARLRWALKREDEVGTVVRVRTFVALRHWILNYFMDDFVVDHTLRVTFCDLLNDLVDELLQEPKERKVPLKILAELKKCWRRVCAQYWDGPDFDESLGADVAISPGGIAGHRDPDLDPTFWLQSDAGPPQLNDLVAPAGTRSHTSLLADVAQAGHIESIVTGERPLTPENIPDKDVLEHNVASPISIASIDAISCSFPSKNSRFAPPGTALPLAAHPADPSAVSHNNDPIATTPRTLVGKRARPQHSHKRNGSLSDSLRDHTNLTEKLLYKNAEFLLALPYAGGLVRGNILPPSQAFVEALPYSTGASARQTTVFQQPPVELTKVNTVASAMSGQGMKRLLGSVRRALSTKGHNSSPTQGAFITISPIGPKGATTNRLPGTAIVPQARSRRHGSRPPVRIDLLGAEIAEDFKKAVREDSAAGNEKAESPSVSKAGLKLAGDDVPEFSNAHLDTSFSFSSEDGEARPVSDMGITAGSKSIVIVDDTSLPENYPVMSGAIPAINSSVEAFAEAFARHGADPTPPNTPPSRPMGTPRRSSYILGQHILRHSRSADPLPRFVHDMGSQGSNPPQSRDYTRPSLDFLNQDPRRPPLSYVRGHTRQTSGRSLFSDRSRGHQRSASFTSGIALQPTVRSFDATTISGMSMDASSPVLVPQPLRVLRRRPGGDLRAVANAVDGDLGSTSLRRLRSVGSLTTYMSSVHSSNIRSPAADSSGFVDVASDEYSPGHAETFSLGAIAGQNPKRHLSLFSTHSSKPVMRPSFEAEAQKLAQIPDDLDDDGGVESALLKLEGKYQRRTGSKLSMDLRNPLRSDLSPDVDSVLVDKTASAVLEEKKEHRHVHVVDEPCPPSPSAKLTTATAPGSTLDVASRNGRRGDGQSFLSDDSGASYSSIPLLERDLTDEALSKRTVTREWTDRSILQGPDEGATPDGHSIHDSQHLSYDFITKTNSIDKIQPGTTMPPAEPTRDSVEHSFLDVASDNASDLSSEMSEEEEEQPPRSNKDLPSLSLPIHLLAGSQPEAAQQASTDPPSPQITLAQALHMSPETAYVPILQDHHVWEKPLPPTPNTTPTTAAVPYGTEPLLSPADPTGTKEALRNAPKLQIPDPVSESARASGNKYMVHLPFILAFDSDILAQQFTLIEKDALNEIDWKELIDMRWKHAEQNGVNVRSWVSFLRDTDARGVEVVIARFNIMVKWAISEIVLTQDIEERARCIIKFIHIASHCRRYRNFATMSQITIALTSNEISRLSRTWAMVPSHDQRTLRDLETLLSPTRNFYNMRAEMEGGGALGPAAAEMGCIPFVGIYTHDLLFNAQKPSEIASSPTTAPLVNFERCRTAAGVVKTLLRLLEASTLYTFQPVEGITERCLWMRALSDEEIRRLSDSLE